MKNLRKTIEKLSSPDPTVRRMAAEALSEGDERAIYPLIKALYDENAGVQDAAMRSLIAIGTEEVAYMTIPLLRENALLRNTALIILTAIGAKAVPLLYTCLKDKDDDIRKFAIDLFGDIREGVDPESVVPFLKDPNTNVRAAAAKTIGRLGYKQYIPHLIEAIKDEEWVCFSALEALADLNAEEAVPEICMLLDSPSEAIVYAAVEALGRLGSGRAIEPLMDFLNRASEDLKSSIIKSLVQIGLPPNLPNICEHLILMFKEGDWEDKEVALQGIRAARCTEATQILIDTAGSLDPSLPENEDKITQIKEVLLNIDSERELLRLIDSEELKFRGKALAIEILGELKSKAAVPRLLGFLNDMRRDLRKASVSALGCIGEPEVVEPLLDISRRDIDSHVRMAAVIALGNMKAKDAYVPLVEMLEYERYHDIIEAIVNSLLQIDAESFLSGIDGYSRNVRLSIIKGIRDISILKTFIQDPDRQIRIMAIQGIGKIGGHEATDILVEFLKDKDPEIRKAALVGLAEAEICKEEIYEALKDTDDWVRFYALQTLVVSCEEQIDIEVIIKMLQDPFIPVVIAAIEYLKSVGGQEVYEALLSLREHPVADVRHKIEEALSQL
jgi:HEAT repeat protein